METKTFCFSVLYLTYTRKWSVFAYWFPHLIILLMIALAVYQRLNSINKKYRSINAMTVHAARVKMGYSVSVSDGISNQSSWIIWTVTILDKQDIVYLFSIHVCIYFTQFCAPNWPIIASHNLASPTATKKGKSEMVSNQLEK
jgi:hypothetical protein